MGNQESCEPEVTESPSLELSRVAITSVMINGQSFVINAPEETIFYLKELEEHRRKIEGYMYIVFTTSSFVDISWRETNFSQTTAVKDSYVPYRMLIKTDVQFPLSISFLFQGDNVRVDMHIAGKWRSLEDRFTAEWSSDKIVIK